MRTATVPLQCPGVCKKRNFLSACAVTRRIGLMTNRAPIVITGVKAAKKMLVM